METSPQKYFYTGKKFTKFTSLKDFKHIIEENFNHFGIEDNFDEYYSSLVNKFASDKVKYLMLSRLFFEHIIYGRLTNIHSYKIKSPIQISEDMFIGKVRGIITEFQVNVVNALQGSMNPRGFYLMDSMNVSGEGANFLAGYDFIKEGNNVVGARFLFGRNVYRKLSDQTMKNEYLLGAVEIDFKNQTLTILTNNSTGIATNEKKIDIDDEDEDEDEDNENNKYSIGLYYRFLREKVTSLLGIVTELNVKSNDQIGMSKLCRNLFDKLIDEYKQTVTENTSALVKTKVKDLVRRIGQIGNKPTKKDTRNLEEKLSALLLGTFVSCNFDAETLRVKAKELKLIGYPTKIHYKNSRTNRSSTGTSTARNPIASSDTLYSLLSDFESTNKLDKWSMSWFYVLNDNEDTDVIQTTIETRKDFLKITLLATRHHNKEIIHHVIGEINSYR